MDEQEIEQVNKENINAGIKPVSGDGAEKNLNDRADKQDSPDENDKQEKEEINQTRNANVHSVYNVNDSDEVKEKEDERVPGYDLGRNKVQ